MDKKNNDGELPDSVMKIMLVALIFLVLFFITGQNVFAEIFGMGFILSGIFATVKVM